MPRALWKGAISFGLVTIPVGLVSAENRASELGFHNIDRTTMSRVRQKRVSEASGDEVPWEAIVKGYEYERGRYVVLEPSEIEAANPKASHTIDIVAVVCRDCIDPPYYTKPYYVVPEKMGYKPYALLREVLARRDQVAVARVVIRTRQYLAALFPAGEALVLDLLRYADELRTLDDLDLPSADLTELQVSQKEIDLADQLVSALHEPAWDPARYSDTYRNDLLDLIRRKVEAGGTAVVPPTLDTEPAGEVVDIMELLKRSLEAADAEKRAAGGASG